MQIIYSLAAVLLLVSTAVGQITESPIAHLSRADGTFYVGAGSGRIVAETGDTVRTSLGLAIGTNVQAYDADLTEWAGHTPSISGGGALLTITSHFLPGDDRSVTIPLSSSTVLTQSGIGSLVQGYDADLTALAGISGVNGDVIIRSGDTWARLAKGTENQVLKMGAELPAWGADTDTDTDTLGAIAETANGDVLIYNSGWTRLGKGAENQVLKMGAALPAWGADTDTNTTYSPGDGLDLDGTTFKVDLKSGGGLEIDDTELRLSTHETAATQSGDGATATLDFSANAIIKFTFDNNGGATTFTFTDPPAGSRCLLILIQDADGGETVVWPVAKTIYWPDGDDFQPDGTASARAVVTLVFDGSEYYCTGYDYAEAP